MERYLKVETDKTHVRDMESNAIVNRNKSEFDNFLELSQKKSLKIARCKLSLRPITTCCCVSISVFAFDSSSRAFT